MPVYTDETTNAEYTYSKIHVCMYLHVLGAGKNNLNIKTR